MSGSAPPGAASAAAGAAAVAVAAAGAYALWARRSAAAADPVVADLNAKTVKGKFMDTFKVLVDEIEAGDKVSAQVARCGEGKVAGREDVRLAPREPCRSLHAQIRAC